MAKPELPSELPEILSSTVALSATEAGVGKIWDIGIDGLGFMVSTLDQESPFEFRSYEIQALPRIKPRIDDAEEPGEQTLSDWWARAQHSLHEGAGQNVFDSPFSSRFKFKTSRGINIWEEGEASLLKDTLELRNDNVEDHHLLSTPDALFYTYNGNLKRDPDPDAVAEGNEAVEATNNGTPINSIASDGEKLYAAFSGGVLGIRSSPLMGALSWTLVNSQIATEIIAFVKGRLIGAKVNSLYEYDLTVTTEPQPFYSDKSAAWRWSGITESGPAIYFSGYIGDRSEIYAARLTAQDIPISSLATIGAMRSVWTAPEGEQINTIKGYLGQQLLIGTSRGVRIGTIVTGEGDIEVSALIVETGSPVLKFDPQLEFAWFTWTNFDSGFTGLGRIHLGELVYASDVMYQGQGTVKDVVLYKDRAYFVVDQGVTSRIIMEHASNLVPDAFFQSCEIRFSTTERKQLRFFDLLTRGTGLWSLNMSVNGGNFVSFTADNEVGGLNEEILDLEGSRFCIRLAFKRDQSDPTKGPVWMEWRLRADPKSPGRFRYFVPLMIYDYLQIKSGAQIGRTGLALSLLNYLQGIYDEDRDFQFQPMQTGIPGDMGSITCKMEDLRFKVYAPPVGGKGFGGIGLVVLKEVR